MSPCLPLLSCLHRAVKFFPVSCLAEAGPKKILDLMNVPWLTRENVASHLQVKTLPCHHHYSEQVLD